MHPRQLSKNGKVDPIRVVNMIHHRRNLNLETAPILLDENQLLSKLWCTWNRTIFVQHCPYPNHEKLPEPVSQKERGSLR